MKKKSRWRKLSSFVPRGAFNPEMRLNGIMDYKATADEMARGIGKACGLRIYDLAKVEVTVEPGEKNPVRPSYLRLVPKKAPQKPVRQGKKKFVRSPWDPKGLRPHAMPAGPARLLSRDEIAAAYPGQQVSTAPAREWQLTYRGKRKRNRLGPKVTP